MWWIFWLWAALKVFGLQELQVFSQLLLAFIAICGVLAAVFIPLRVRADQRSQLEKQFTDRRAAIAEALTAELQQVYSEARQITARLDFLDKPANPVLPQAGRETELQMMELPDMPLLGAPQEWCSYLSPAQAKALSEVNAAVSAFRQTKSHVLRPDLFRFVEKAVLNMNIRAEAVVQKASDAIDSLHR